MLRLFCLLIFSFVVSIICFATIRVLLVAMALFVYGGHYSWGADDIRFILIQGACLGVLFSIFVVIKFISTLK
jgi:hypothetical protein